LGKKLKNIFLKKVLTKLLKCGIIVRSARVTRARAGSKKPRALYSRQTLFSPLLAAVVAEPPLTLAAVVLAVEVACQLGGFLDCLGTGSSEDFASSDVVSLMSFVHCCYLSFLSDYSIAQKKGFVNTFFKKKRRLLPS